MVFLLAGSNWNNATNEGVANRNANNVATNTNRNISTHLELRTTSSPEQRFNPTEEVKYTKLGGKMLVILYENFLPPGVCYETL